MGGEWTAVHVVQELPTQLCRISTSECMQGWDWSTEEEPDPARAVMPHSAGRHCAIMLGYCIASAVALTFTSMFHGLVSLRLFFKKEYKLLTHAASNAP